MNDQMISAARTALAASEANALTFPQIVANLKQAGFESYAIDFRAGTATYFTPDGDSTTLPFEKPAAPVAAAFDEAALVAAIREAQQLVPGYSYKGFCRKAAAAGCAGYMVSFPGRRALYVARTAETHTEHFPK